MRKQRAASGEFQVKSVEWRSGRVQDRDKWHRLSGLAGKGDSSLFFGSVADKGLTGTSLEVWQI